MANKKDNIKLMFTLATARSLAGLSTKDATKELGVSARTLLNYENGITSPRMSVVDKMVELYGIPFENLIYDIKHYDVKMLLKRTIPTSNSTSYTNTYTYSHS